MFPVRRLLVQGAIYIMDSFVCRHSDLKDVLYPQQTETLANAKPPESTTCSETKGIDEEQKEGNGGGTIVYNTTRSQRAPAEAKYRHEEEASDANPHCHTRA